MVALKRPNYPSNGYMKGTCPGCKEWEAPITPSELDHMLDDYAYHGSSEKVQDARASYYRVVWTENFQCPKCKTRFGVVFSNI